MSTQEEIKNEALTWPEKAKGLIIWTDSIEQAGEWLTAIGALMKEADAVFDPVIKAAHKAHTAAIAAKRSVTRPLDEAKRIIKAKVLKHQEEERRLAAEEAARLQAIADSKDEEKRLAEAIAAEGRDQPELAEALISEKPTVIMPAAPAKVAGFTPTKRWKAEVTDLLALVQFVAANPEYLHLVKGDTTQINRTALPMREKCEIPGVRVWQESGVRS
jgi:hypothetical protein